MVRVDAVTGRYDAVAEVEADDADNINDIAAEGAHSVGGITETVACIAT